MIMNNKKITISKIKQFKSQSFSFSAVTAYDFHSARIADNVDIPLILVGDSAAMVMYGYDSTVPITVDEMLLIVRAVSRAVKSSLIVADMPFLSYQTSTEDTIRNAGKFIKHGGANAVKIEGGSEILERVVSLSSIGIPVVGHLGLTPQYINSLSGYRVQGKSLDNAKKIYYDALELESAGAFALVLECIPLELAKIITDKLTIPTIGIGAGPFCDGQIQVYHDLLGIDASFFPVHSKQYINLNDKISVALQSFKLDVESGVFPKKSNSVTLDSKIIDKLKKVIK